ncbi:MAG: hypothetical protein GX786_01985 [Clostridiales bacterium]|nr:hypothetical protein [Clostridiales bacterium]
MANCPRCNATLLQGYDHCVQCGLPLQAMQGAVPPQPGRPSQQGTPPPGANFPPAQQSSSSGGKNPLTLLAAKIDTQGFVWMITGAVQIAYALVTAVSAFILFIQASAATKVAETVAIGKYNRTLALISIVAMILIAIIGFLNFTDGKKRKDNAGWVLSNPTLVLEQYSPISALLPSLIRNFIFLLALSLGLLSLPVIIMGLIGLVGMGMLLNIRYVVLRDMAPTKR